jgi:hypothetical protein
MGFVRARIAPTLIYMQIAAKLLAARSRARRLLCVGHEKGSS